MVKVIMGKRGSGKTKQVIDLVNTAVHEEAGNVICIEKGQNLRFNIKYSAKLIDISEYPMELSYESMFSFICGLYSGNYDITHVFVDNLYKITGEDDNAKADEFLTRLEKFAEESGVKFTLTISDDIENASDGVRKYLI